MSPVFDSVFTTWWIADLPIGPAQETMATILADVGTALGLPPQLAAAARILNRSRFGVYRVELLSDREVTITELLTE